LVAVDHLALGILRALSVGGDNSKGAAGTFYEGVLAGGVG
jgi:hypothetical protein